MSSLILNRLFYFITTHLLFTLLFANLIFSQPENFNASEILQNIKHADTFYKLGMFERGNMQAFRASINYLDKAESLLENSNLAGNLKKEINSNIYTLRQNVNEQADMAHDTFYGVFPIVRYLNSNIFLDSQVYDTFELFDDPAIIAVTKNLQLFCDNFIRDYKQDIQFEVFFTSDPDNPAYENEVKYFLNQHPKFFINDTDLNSLLSSDELLKLNSGFLSDSAGDRVYQIINDKEFLLVNIRELDVVDDVYFFQIEGRIFKSGISNEIQNIKIFSFARDRTMLYYPMWLLNIIMVIIAIATFIYFLKKNEEKKEFFIKGIFISILAFLIGRFFPLVIIPIFQSFKPEPETLAILSFWWVVMFGIAMFLGPLLIIKTVYSKFSNLFHDFTFDGKLEYILIAINLGVLSYIIEFMLLYYTEPLRVLFPALVLIISSTFYMRILGNSIDRGGNLPISFAFFAIIFIAFLATISFSDKLDYIYFGLIGILIYPLLNKAIVTSPTPENNLNNEPTDPPRTVEELIQRISNPPYFNNYPEYLRIIEKVFASSDDSCFTIIGLYGIPGIGKSALSNHLISVIKQNNSNSIVLRGVCPENSSKNSEETPFSPFQEAFKEIFHFNIFSPPDEQLKSLDDSFSEVVESLIPLAGFIFPNGGNSSARPVSDEHQRMLVKNTLIDLPPKSGTIILFFDDAQWLDISSRKLLSFLINKLQKEQRRKIYFIFCAREERDFEFLPFQSSANVKLVELAALSKADRIRFLIENFGMDNVVASFIIDQISEGENNFGDMHLLLRIFEYLARNNYLERNADTRLFTWKEEYKNIDKLPIPDDYRNSLRIQISDFPQYRKVLYGAACIGKVFNVSLLANCIDMSKLMCLEILHEIEETTGFVLDGIAEDDYFSFKSTFLLEVLREEMKINSNTPELRQIIKEYHKNIATNLEKLLNENPAFIYDVARHFSLSGISNSEKAIKYSLMAARASLNIYQTDNAKRFFELAKDLAKLSNKTFLFELDFMLFECELSHMTYNQNDKSEFALKCKNYVKHAKDISSEQKLIICRTYYEGQYYEDCRELSDEIINETSKIEVAAEAFQFKGLSFKSFDERHKNLQKGYNLLIKEFIQKDIPAENFEIEFESIVAQRTSSEFDLHKLKLFARIANSIADNLALNLTSLDNLNEIEKLYSQSLAIKKLEDINDKKGQAITAGSLGRLYLKSYEMDSSDKYLELAINNFSEDLKISREIGDEFGETIMLNYLGECEFLLKNYDSSVEYFKYSEALSKDSLNLLFINKGYFQANLMITNMSEVKRSWFEIKDILMNNQKLIWFKDTVLIPLLDRLKTDVEVEIYYRELSKLK